MGRFNGVNWARLHSLGNKTSDNAGRLEESRKKLQELFSSTSSCWIGVDANAFRNNTNRYFENMKEDIYYLQEWSNFYTKAASVYSDSVRTAANVIKQSTMDLEDSKGSDI